MRQSVSSSRLASLVFLSAAWLVAYPVSACTVCFGFPEQTDADRLLDAKCVVLARTDEADPFSFSVKHVLKGSVDSRPIGLFVDSRTRRTLKVHPERWVVLTQSSDGDAWHSLGVASDAYLSVVRRLVLLSSDATFTPKKRWEFFLPLFGHTDQRLRELAYLEMGRAPYHVIQRLSKVADREDWIAVLEDRRYVKWRSLAILLLAHSPRAEDRARVRESFRSAHRFALSTNLAAWAAAAIEVEGETAIEFIEQAYVADQDRSPEELAAIMTALSMHGSQPESRYQARIARTYQQMLIRHPQFESKVANDLFAWGLKER